MHDKLSGRSRRPEDVSLRRQTPRLAPDRVIEIVCRLLGTEPADVSQRRRDSLLRPIVARMLCPHSGLTQRRTAELVTSRRARR